MKGQTGTAPGTHYEKDEDQSTADLVHRGITEAAAVTPPPAAPTLQPPAPGALSVVYRNHRGEVATRRIVPLRVYYGETVWHPTQWMLDCYDLDKGAVRTFCLADCDFDGAEW